MEPSGFEREKEKNGRGSVLFGNLSAVCLGRETKIALGRGQRDGIMSDEERVRRSTRRAGFGTIRPQLLEDRMVSRSFKRKPTLHITIYIYTLKKWISITRSVDGEC